jgi:hypothetical protein
LFLRKYKRNIINISNAESSASWTSVGTLMISIQPMTYARLGEVLALDVMSYPEAGESYANRRDIGRVAYREFRLHVQQTQTEAHAVRPNGSGDVMGSVF